MATTTNYGWSTPDDTALVKNGAAAIRTLGSSIDTSMAELKGGVSGSFLTKSSATDMDFTWATSVPVGSITTAAEGVGFMGLPQNSTTTGAYSIVAADAGKHIYSTATRTITIPSNAGTALPIGTTISFVAATGATVTIAITTDTLILAGTGTTGSRTLAAFGMATAVKITATSWIISGNGLT